MRIGIMFGFLAALISGAAQASPQPVPFVDLGRYVGDWYQIAHVPLFFENGKCVCTRQRLTPLDNGVVKVYNSCNESNARGKFVDIAGTATNDDPTTNSKFTVDFNVGRKGSYWIVGLDKDYRYAVVTDSYSYSLYILSKTPTLSKALFNEALDTAKKQNLRWQSLEMTSQPADCEYPR